MKSTTHLVAFTLVLPCAHSLASTTARAEQASPEPSAPIEITIGAGQLLLGGAVSTLGGSVILLAGATGGLGGALVGMVAAPPLTGALVCWLGGKSPAYDDDCDGAVLGSYLGSLAVFPGMVLGARLGENGEDDMSEALSMLAAGMLGYIAGTTVGATMGWHLGKERRQPPALKVGLPGPLQPRLLGLTERRRASRAAGEINVPLLALTF